MSGGHTGPKGARLTADQEAAIRVGTHECVTCTRCATTYAIVHPACPRCSQEERDAAELAAAREALTRIQQQQPATLEKLRSNGVVFDGPLGNDPSNWQHVAFSIYTDLCEIETIARTALEKE